VNQRIAVNDEGRIASWDYKLGFVYGHSLRENYYDSGYVSGADLLKGMATAN
jgi:iron complex outermembrane receptor protein